MKQHPSFISLFLLIIFLTNTFIVNCNNSNQCILPEGQILTTDNTNIGHYPYSTVKFCKVSGERYIFDVSNNETKNLGCMNLTVCPKSRSLPLTSTSTNEENQCGCGDGGDLPFLDGHVWVVQICEVGEFCLPQGVCSSRSSPVLVASTQSRTEIKLEIQSKEAVTESNMRWFASGVPGQRQTVRLQHCLPYQLSPGSTLKNLNVQDPAVSERCGTSQLAFDDDYNYNYHYNNYKYNSKSSINIATFDVTPGFYGSEVIVQGSIHASFPVDASFPTATPESGYVKLVSLVCAIGAEQKCQQNQKASPQAFSEIHHAYYTPRQITNSSGRPFTFVHDLGVDFDCASSKYVITCTASLHFSQKGSLKIGKNGCPSRNGQEHLVRYIQREAMFKCAQNKFMLEQSKTNPIDPMYIFQYKKFGMKIEGISDIPTLLVNKTQLLSRVSNLAQKSGSSSSSTGTSSGISEITLEAPGLLKMEPIYVDVALDMTEQFTRVNSAIIAHLGQYKSRSVYGPVDIDNLRQKISKTNFLAATDLGWWSVKLNEAPNFHEYKDVRVVVDLLTEGEIGPLSSYDDLRVWIGSTLPRDRTISGSDAILRQEFDIEEDWQTPKDYCAISNSCQNGAACSNGPNSVYCTCGKMFSGALCEHAFVASGSITASNAMDNNIYTKAVVSRNNGAKYTWWKLDMKVEHRVKSVEFLSFVLYNPSYSSVLFSAQKGGTCSTWSSSGNRTICNCTIWVSDEPGSSYGKGSVLSLPNSNRIDAWYVKHNHYRQGLNTTSKPYRYSSTCCATDQYYEIRTDSNSNLVKGVRVQPRYQGDTTFITKWKFEYQNNGGWNWVDNQKIYTTNSEASNTTVLFSTPVNAQAIRFYPVSSFAGLSEATARMGLLVKDSGLEVVVGNIENVEDETMQICGDVSVASTFPGFSIFSCKTISSGGKIFKGEAYGRYIFLRSRSSNTIKITELTPHFAGIPPIFQVTQAHLWQTDPLGTRGQTISGSNAFIFDGSSSTKAFVSLPNVNGLVIPKTPVGDATDGVTFSFWYQWIDGDVDATRSNRILVLEANQDGKILVSMDEFYRNSLRIDIVLSSRYQRHLRTIEPFFQRQDEWIHIVVRVGKQKMELEFSVF